MGNGIAATITGHCQADHHGACDGVLRNGTGWNWWCTCTCHPEPVAQQPEFQPAVDFWRRARARQHTGGTGRG